VKEKPISDALNEPETPNLTPAIEQRLTGSWNWDPWLSVTRSLGVWLFLQFVVFYSTAGRQSSE
jgi:hypothetical protein